MPEDNLKKLYTNLIKDNYDLPNYEIFKLDMLDSNKSLKLYTNLLKDNYDLPSYDQFVQDISPFDKVENYPKVIVPTEPTMGVGEVKENIAPKKSVGKFSVEQNRGKNIGIERAGTTQKEIIKTTVTDKDTIKSVDKNAVYKNIDNLLSFTSNRWTTPKALDYIEGLASSFGGETIEEKYPDNYYALRTFEKNVAGLDDKDRKALAFKIQEANIPDDAKQEYQKILDNTEYVSTADLTLPLVSNNSLRQDIAVGAQRHTQKSLLFATSGLLDPTNPTGRIKEWFDNELTGYGLEKQTVSDLVSEMTGGEIDENTRFARSMGSNIGYMSEMAAITYLTGGMASLKNIFSASKAVGEATTQYGKLFNAVSRNLKGAVQTGVQFEISNQLQAGRGEGFMTGVGEYAGGRVVGSLIGKTLNRNFVKELSKRLPGKIAITTGTYLGGSVGQVVEELSGETLSGNLSNALNDKNYMKDLALQSLMLGLGGVVGSAKQLRSNQRKVFEQSVNNATDKMVEDGIIPEESKADIKTAVMETFDEKKYAKPTIEELTKEVKDGLQEKGQEEITSSIATTQTSKSTLPGSANVEETGSSATTTPSTEGEVDNSIDDYRKRVVDELYDLIPPKKITGISSHGIDGGFYVSDMVRISDHSPGKKYDKTHLQIGNFNEADFDPGDYKAETLNKIINDYNEWWSNIGQEMDEFSNKQIINELKQKYPIDSEWGKALQNKLSTTTDKNIVLDKPKEISDIEEKGVQSGTQEGIDRTGRYAELTPVIRRIESFVRNDREGTARTGKGVRDYTELDKALDDIESLISSKKLSEITKKIEADLIAEGIDPKSEKYSSEKTKRRLGKIFASEDAYDIGMVIKKTPRAVRRIVDSFEQDKKQYERMNAVLDKMEARGIRYGHPRYNRVLRMMELASQSNILKKEILEQVKSNKDLKKENKGAEDSFESNEVVRRDIEEYLKTIEPKEETNKSNKPLGYVGRSAGRQALYKEPVTNPEHKDSDLNNPVYLKSISRVILKALNMNEDIDVRSGLVKRFKRKAKAIFFPNSNIIRVSTINDFDSLIHEIGHYIDLTLKNITGGLNKKRDAHSNQIRKEIRGLLKDTGYPSKDIKEGFAEMTRLYVEDRKYIRNSYPTTYGYFDGIINSDQTLRDLFESLSKHMNELQRQDDRVKIESTISRNDEDNGFMKGIEKFFDGFIYNVYDNVKYFRDLSDKIAKSGGIESQYDPLLNVLTVIGNSGKGEQYLVHSTFQRDGNDIVLEDIPGLLKILAPIIKDGKLKQLEGYLVALRNIELINRGMPNAATLPLEQSKNVQKLYEEEFGKEYLDGIRKQIDDYNDALLRFYRDAGKISQDTYEKMRELNKYYVPFNRYIEEYERKGKKLNVKQVIRDYSFDAVKRIKGSDRQIVSPIESMIENTMKIIASSENNRALSNIITAMNRLDKNLAQKIPPTVIKRKYDTDGNIVYTREKQKPNTNIVTVDVNGTKEFYEIPKEYYDSFFQLNSTANDIIRIMSAPSRWLQAGAVSLDPTFGIRNIFRDQITAYFNSRYGYNPLWMVRGFSDYIKKDEYYQKWLASGGDFSFLTSLDEMLQDKEISKKVGGLTDKFIAKYKNPIKLAQAFNRVTEIGTRVGLFNKAYIETGDVYLSMQESRTATGDYGVRGATLGGVLPFMPFLNARMQHQITTLRTMKNNPNAFLFKGMTIAVPSILLWLYNNYDDDDRKLYQGLPEWRRLFLWNIKVPGQEWFIPIPKGLYGVLFGTSVESFLDYVYGGDGRTAKDLPMALVKEWMPMTTVQDAIPHPIKPLLENAINYSTFKQKKLVPEQLLGAEPSEQYFDDTPEIYKALGELTSYSPLKIKNLFEGYGGGFVSGSVQLSDWLGRKLGTIEDRTEPTFTQLSRLPILKAFITAEPYGKRSSYVDDFYDKLDELESMNKTINMYIEHNNNDKLGKYLGDEKRAKDYQWYLKNQTQINYFKNILSGTRKLQNEIKLENKDNYKEKIYDLEKKITDVAIEFRDAYNNRDRFYPLRKLSQELKKVKSFKSKNQNEINKAIQPMKRR